MLPIDLELREGLSAIPHMALNTEVLINVYHEAYSIDYQKGGN